MFRSLPRRFGGRVALAVFFALVVEIATPVAAADLAPSWTALPDETVLLLRVPGGESFVDALRSQTKLGTVLLSAERLERLKRIIRKDSEEFWDSVPEGLGRYGLGPDDWRGLFRGEVGAALTLRPRDQRIPLFVALGWLEPGEELAPRVISALGSLLAEESDLPSGAKRKDIELAGHEVMHIEFTLSGLSMPTLPDAAGAAGDSPEELQKSIEEFQNRLKDAKEIETDRMHLFVSRLGGRIVWGCTIPQSAAEVQAKSDAERAAIDWDALTGVEEATAVFGHFLSAHEGSGQPPQLARAAGIEANRPGGAPLIEIVADPRPLLPLAEKSPNPKTKQVLEALGVNGVGPIALRMALDGTTLRTGTFVSLPTPRGGLLALIDQPPLEPEPPAWAPANAVGYQHLSFEIDKAYDRLKGLFTELSGDQGRQAFDQIETAAKTFLQVDLHDLLGSIEQQISVVTFTPRLGKAVQTDQFEDDDEPPVTVGPQLIQRVGIVLRVKDEQLWRKLLEIANRFAQGGALGGLQAVEEQGFQGFRVDQADNHVGIFLGHGYLVLGVGPEVSESLLSVLRSPPEGATAMRGSGLVERGRELLAPQPGLHYTLEDAGKTVAVTRQLLESLLNSSLTTGLTAPALAASAAGADDKEVIEQLKTLLPGDAELQGILGVSVSQWIATDDGLVIQWAVELPAP